MWIHGSQQKAGQWLPYRGTEAHELIWPGWPGEGWQRRGQRRAADLVFGGSMRFMEGTWVRGAQAHVHSVYVKTDRNAAQMLKSTQGQERNVTVTFERMSGIMRLVEMTREKESSHGNMLQNTPTHSKKTKQYWTRMKRLHWLFLGGMLTGCFNFLLIKFLIAKFSITV